MQLNWGRAITATLMAEVAGLLMLFVIVAIFSPDGTTEAAAFAQEVGARAGPLAGFLFCIIGGWWTAKTAPAMDRIANGAAMGVLAAALNIALALAFGGAIGKILIFTNLGRILAGTLGGWLGAREG